MRTISSLLFATVVGLSGPALALEVYTLGPQALRDAPAQDAPALATLLPGSKVDMKTCAEGWCRVVVEGREGWIPEAVLKLRGHAP